MPKTERARRVATRREIGRTKEEAEANARMSVAPKVKGQPERAAFLAVIERPPAWRFWRYDA